MTGWLRERERESQRLVQPVETYVDFEVRTGKSSKTGSDKVCTRRGKSAFSMRISLKAGSDNEWELAIKTPLCKLYTNVPTFPHTCFDMQIAMKEI